MDQTVTVIIVNKQTNKVTFVIDSVLEYEAQNVVENMKYAHPDCRVYFEGEY